MVTKIDRKTCFEIYTIFPVRIPETRTEEEKFFYPEIFNSYILTVPSKSFKGHIKILASELTKLAEALSASSLIFHGDIETPWLNQDNNYSPAKKAQDYLKSQKIGKRFNGALQVDYVELPTFVVHLSWLTRCNASLPYFYFTDPGQNILGQICQYGNLHLDTLNEQSDQILKYLVENNKFEFGDERSCR